MDKKEMDQIEKDANICSGLVGSIVFSVTMDYGESESSLKTILSFLHLLNHSQETEKILTEAIDKARVNQSPPRPKINDNHPKNS